MTSIATWIKKATVIAITIMLGVISVPNYQAVAANEVYDAAAMPASQVTDARLQHAFSKEQRISNKLGKFFDVVDGRISKGQALIDKAKANGKGVSSTQTALDAFSQAVTQARPVFQAAKGSIVAHAGFDQTGIVTDPALARQTVQMLKDEFKQIHQLLHKPRHDLHQAIRNFRKANNLTPTPTKPGA